MIYRITSIGILKPYQNIWEELPPLKKHSPRNDSTPHRFTLLQKYCCIRKTNLQIEIISEAWLSIIAYPGSKGNNLTIMATRNASPAVNESCNVKTNAIPSIKHLIDIVTSKVQA